MPTLSINGQTVTVGDEFTQLTPEQQDATVDEIARELGLQSEGASGPGGASLPAQGEPNALTDALYQGATGFNRGLTSAIEAPTNLANAGLDAAGVPENLRFPSPLEANAPALREWMTRDPENQTAAGDVAESIGEFAGANAIPAMGAIGMAPRVAAATSGAAGTLGQSVNRMAADIASRPGVAMGGEALASTGAGVGAQIGRDVSEGNPNAEIIGATVGGLAAPWAVAASPTNIARKAGGAVARRISPSRMAEKGRNQVREALRENMTEEAQANINDTVDLQNNIPGYRPSVAEATEVPSFMSTQEGFERELSGPDLDRARQRYRQNEQAVARAQEDQAPQSSMLLDEVFGQGRNRVDDIRARIAQGNTSLDADARNLTEGIRPRQRRREVGQGIRDDLITERGRTREEMNITAREMGLNDPAPRYNFGSVRQGLLDRVTPRSQLEDPSALPNSIISDIQAMDDQASIVDMMSLRTRIDTDLREAQRTPTGEKRVPYLQALKSEVDAATEQMLRSSGNQDLANNLQEFRRIYLRDFVQPFEQGAAGNVLRKDSSGVYRVPDEEVASEFFNGWDQTAADQFQQTFRNAPRAHAAMEAAAMDDLYASAVVEGVIDPSKVSQWARRHQGAIGSFPGIQRRLGNVEGTLGSIARRRRTLENRERMVERSYLARELGRIDNAVSQTTPESVIDQAIRNPQRMQNVLRSVRSDEAKNAIARQVWKTALDADNPASFLRRNSAAIQPALGPRYEAALRLARAIEKNRLVRRPSGQAMDTNPVASLEGILGTGLNQISSRIFAVQSGRTSGRWVLTDIAGRAFRTMSGNAARQTLEDAIYDPQVATDLANTLELGASSPQAIKRIYTFLIGNGIVGLDRQQEAPQPEDMAAEYREAG